MTKKNQKPRFFQYIDGENKGKVVVLKDIFEESGEVFYEFDDGEAMNKAFISPMTTSANSLKNKFAIEVQSPDPMYLWGFKEVKEVNQDLGNMEFVSAPPLEDILNATRGEAGGDYVVGDSALGKVKLNYPRNNSFEPTSLPNVDWFYEPQQVEVKSIQHIEEVVDDEPKDKITLQTELFVPEGEPGSEGPMQAFGGSISDVPKQIKNVVEEQEILTEDEAAVANIVKKVRKHATDIPIVLTMDLPAKSVYELVQSEFDDGGTIFVNEIVKSLTNEQIVAAVKAGLKEAYDAVDE